MYFDLMGKLLALEDSLRDGWRGRRPLIYDFGDKGRHLETEDVNTFFDGIEKNIKLSKIYVQKYAMWKGEQIQRR